MDYFPIFLDIKQQPCLLVGGGEIALRKARLLVSAGARLKVIAHQVLPELQTLLHGEGGSFELRDYQITDLDGVRLVVAATDDQRLNQQISQDANARQLPVNVVDSPKLCSFITPAIIDRSPLIVAVSSGGDAPVLARLTRMKLETLLPQGLGKLASLGKRWRAAVKVRFKDLDQRRYFWEQALESPIAEAAMRGSNQQADQLMQQALDTQQTSSIGEVYLVGGGPGDPELLTLKALRLMQQADVVLYDRLVSEAVMNLVRRDAERIYVGKRRNDHSVPQTEINQQLVDLAKQGKRVLRLKGGDPFIFGRGGEEIELLADAGVPFQVVPGITAASGCAAYAGIPLTHRDYAQSVRFVTGHLKDDQVNLQWPELAVAGQTLVLYMGLLGLPEVCKSLMAHGRAASTPVALIEKGTTPEQRVFTGTLATITDYIANEQVRAPTLIIVGEVVGLHQKLAWFGDKSTEKSVK